MFQGLYTALITPFNEDYSIDMESITNIITQQFNAKVNGIILFGTSGEGMTLTHDEKNQVIKYAIDLINKLTMESKTLLNGKPYKPHVIVGTGTNCTKTTIDQSMQAEKLGADGVMIVTPYYNRPSQDGIYEHYKSINDAINIPIILYNVPTRTGVHIEDITLIKLMELSNICSLKDYDSLRPIRIYIDWSAMQKVNTIQSHNTFIKDAYSNYELFVAACTSKFTILAGDDVNSLSIYVNGGHGCVSVASNIIPEICFELHDAAQQMHMEKARAIHAHLHPIYSSLFCEVNPVPVKYAAYKIGLIKTPVVRQPLHIMSSHNQEKVSEILLRYGLI
jgi:4-hydroxy-tetrahydrodipicolinate synthase